MINILYSILLTEIAQDQRPTVARHMYMQVLIPESSELLVQGLLSRCTTAVQKAYCASLICYLFELYKQDVQLDSHNTYSKPLYIQQTLTGYKLLPTMQSLIRLTDHLANQNIKNDMVTTAYTNILICLCTQLLHNVTVNNPNVLLGNPEQ